MTLETPDSRCVDLVRASPNHGVRLGRGRPDCIVLHYTGMADGTSAIDWLCSPIAQVSSHYVVEEDGRVLQLVAEARRAWHAGRSVWAGRTDLNSASVGIEIVNGGHRAGLPPFPPAQIEAVIRLCRDIADRQSIRPERILGHSDIAPGRKIDPGERFPWEQLYAGGVGLWVPEQGRDGLDLDVGREGDAVAELQHDLAAYGYGIEASGRYDDLTRIVVEAFQRHFRLSRVDGIADAGTRATLESLLTRLRAGEPGGMSVQS